MSSILRVSMTLSFFFSICRGSSGDASLSALCPEMTRLLERGGRWGICFM